MSGPRRGGWRHLLIWTLAALAAGPASAWDVPAGEPLEQTFARVRANGLNLVSSSALLPSAAVAEAMVQAATPAEALDACLRPHGLRLRRQGGAYFVVEAGERSRGRVELRLRPADGDSAGEALTVEFAAKRSSVRLRWPVGDALRVTSDGLAPGAYSLVVRRGDEPLLTRDVRVRARRTLDLELSLGAPNARMEEITVSASRYALVRDDEWSSEALDQVTLARLPALGGDPLRAVTRLPGVSANGLGAGLRVRGGDAEETTVFFDGLEMVEPFHLKYFQEVFSTIDSRLVGRLDLFTGGYPVRYGSALSGLVNMQSRAPPDALSGEIFADLLQTGGRVAIPFGDGRTVATLFARRSNLDLLSDLLTPRFGSPSYTDALVSLSHQRAGGRSLRASFVQNDDDIALSEPDGGEFASSRQRSRYAWMVAEHAIGDIATGRTLLAYTDTRQRRMGLIDEPDDQVADLDDRRDVTLYQLRQDWTLFPTEDDRLVVDAGLDLRAVRTCYQHTSSRAFFEPLEELVDTVASVRAADLCASGADYGAYAAARVQALPRVAFDLGLRFDGQSYYDFGDDQQVSPRLGVRLTPTDRTRLRASWGVFHQAEGVQELQVSDGVNQFFPAQRAEHAIVSLEHEFSVGLRVRVEAYRKRFSRLRPRFENLFASVELLPELQADRVRIDATRARASGVEVSLSGESSTGDLSWWVTYARTRAVDVVEGVEVPRSWDQPNALAAGLAFERGPWSFALAGRYHTGWPITEILLGEDEEGEPIPVLGSRNAARLRDYAAIDLRLSYRRPLPRGELNVFFELLNSTNRRNVCCIGYDFEDDDEEEVGVALEPSFDQWIPRVPNVGISWSF
ncbi:MAG: TonB-dependent receptor [Pseudomonadota bacterium]